MGRLQHTPTAVLVVGGATADVDRVVSAAGAADSVSDVRTRSSVDGALEALGAEDVGCVVLLETDGCSPAAALRRVRETNERVPVAVHVPASACDVAALAGDLGCVYLPERSDDEAIRDAVGAAVEDFAERRRTAVESDLFETILADCDQTIFVKDDRGRYVYRSDVEGDPDPETVIGETETEVAPTLLEAEARLDYEDDMRVIEMGEPIYEKERRYERGSYEFWLRHTKVPWRDEAGVVRGLVGFSQNVSRQKIYERHLHEQGEQVDQFIDYVTHDLRTPLQIIYGALDLARDGDASALDTIENASERVEHIVDDLGNLVRRRRDGIPTGTALRAIRAESLTTDFVPLIEGIWSVIETDEARLVLELPDETRIGTEVDRLRPVLENLLKNAVEHAGPDVTVWIGETEGNGFYVADDGPGIPEAERDDVIERGYTTASDGTGTGLDIVAQTAVKETWELTVTESRAGGARFEIENLPMVTRATPDVRASERVPFEGNLDVGPVSTPGRATYDEATDRWTVVADGQDVWGDVHEFHFVHVTGRAPARIEARVADFEGVDEFTKAGVTIRGGLGERAPFGYVGRTDARGTEVLWRAREDGFTNSHHFDELPGTFPWYRVDYVGDVITCYVAEDGQEWFPVDQRTIDLGDQVSLGLLVCSHNSRKTCEMTFADVRAYELEVE